MIIKKNQTAIKSVGGKWYIDKYKFQDTPYQEKAVEKKRENQRRQYQGSDL